MMDKSLCIAGKNDIAVSIANYVITKYPKVKLYIIVNGTDDGRDTWQKSLKKFACEFDLDIVTLNQMYLIENLVFLSLEFDKIIQPSKFKTKFLYNLHFSMLPKYKGMYTSIWPLINGEKESGVSLHKIDCGIDTGSIISQAIFKINFSDTGKDLYMKYIKYGVKLMKNDISSLLYNTIKVEAQQVSEGASYYSKNSIDFKKIDIDLNKTAYEIHNQIRAFIFEDYQLPVVKGFEINKTKITDVKSVKKPGTIITDTQDVMQIASVDYDILLKKDHMDELFVACKLGDLNILKKLLPFIPEIDRQNKMGWTLLMVATYNNHIEIVKELLANGADIYKTNYKGTTILMYAKDAAVIHNDYNIIEIILENGANMNTLDCNGLSVLDYCKREKCNGIIKIFKRWEK